MERSFSVNDGLDYSGDASVGSFFSSDYKRHDDLKQMLDSNRDNLKLEAMKRIIGMVAKGRDASELFPAVVKNVVSKNTEVKKLVYVYLMRYAEEQQDLALLSISTFQRALKDPNQLIRGSALRVLSSIRVPVIVPIVMLAIRDASSDMSPYVRKTAAHAFPKLYSLDPEQKDELIQILDKLLADKTTLVVGSAVMAFEEVCPDRVDMIHKNYRKLCALLVDVDEWGQVVILNMLTRYARSQFVDPNIGDMTIDGEEKPFYEDEEGEEEDEAARHAKEAQKNRPQMDPDHRLLLKNSRPLLQSRNASVVMAVVQLYHHVAPKTEVPLVVKALIRLLRSHVEVQAVVLTCIAAMSTERKSLFEPYIKSFFVRSSDPTQIKLLKLEILTNIANETNIPPILREFQTYISSQDKKFVAATIQAIGRCASNIKEVAETCLNGLVSLLSHRDPAVVGGAVVVAKTLLQTQRSGNKAVIAQLAKMVDRVTVPPARAAILWLLGEHCERLPNLPPDVLRKMAKTFSDEEDIVKLQIINLAAKLQLTNPNQTTLLCQYILNLAKYDQSYDIRDRARFLRHLLFPENPESAKLPKLAKRILLSSKPAPVLQSKFKDRDHFQLGSLSHFLNSRANGYQDLPAFPIEAPDSSLRNVEPPPSAKYEDNLFMDLDGKKGTKKGKQSSKKKSFYSDGSGSDNGSGSQSGSSSSSSSSSGTEDSESDSDSSSDASSSCSSGAGSSDEEAPKTQVKKSAASNKPKSNSDGKLNDRKVVRYSDGLDDSDSEGKSGDDDAKSSSEHSSSSASSSSGGSSASSESEEEEDQKRKTKSKKNEKSGKVLTRSQNQTKVKPQPGVNAGMSNSGSKGKKTKTNNVDELLLDLDLGGDTPASTASGDSTSQSASMISSLGGILAPTVGQDSSLVSSSSLASLSTLESSSAMYTPAKSVELVNKMGSGGLQIMSRFTRSPHLESSSLISIELTISNVTTKETFKQIRVGNKSLASGISVHDFERIEILEPGKVMVVTLGIDFNDTTQGAKMEILWATEVEPLKKHTVTITAPVGELIRAVSMSEAHFIAQQGKLRGMNEHETKTLVNPALGDSSSTTRLVQKVYETANLLQVPSTQDDLVRFAGQTTSNKTLVLVTIYLPKKTEDTSSNSIRLVVNCEKMVIASMLLQELKEALK